MARAGIPWGSGHLLLSRRRNIPKLTGFQGPSAVPMNRSPLRILTRFARVVPHPLAVAGALALAVSPWPPFRAAQAQAPDAQANSAAAVEKSASESSSELPNVELSRELVYEFLV